MMWQLTESANTGAAAREAATSHTRFISLPLALPDRLATRVAAGTRRLQVDGRYAIGGESDDPGSPTGHSRLVDAGIEHPPRGRGLGVETVEEEIPEAVDDGFAAVNLRSLRHVRMSAHDHRRAGIEHAPGEDPLTFAGIPFVFPSPVQERNDDVGVL